MTIWCCSIIMFVDGAVVFPAEVLLFLFALIIRPEEQHDNQ